MTKIVLVTGGFDPIHSGHIEYFKSAKKLGDKLIVGVNSDAWLTRKKGHPFMPWKERANIVYHLEMVDDVIMFDDTDGSACGAIAAIKAEMPEYVVVFANGGDRTKTNIPEIDRYGDDDMVEFAFGVGGENKMNSSSWILNDFYKKKTKLITK
jgi:D-beta-D-heptose 7-phosphate kinase/D-beta-D-heptose 1-phosphate adenosyltransferase